MIDVCAGFLCDDLLVTDRPPLADESAAGSAELRFLVVGVEPLKSTAITLVVIAPSAEIAEGFVRTRGVMPRSVVRLGADEPVPGEVRVLRVPPDVVPEPPTRRRLRLLSLSIGLMLFLIAAVLFMYKAKEHLGR